MNVKVAESDADLERISGVLLQLRNAFDRETLIAQIKQQREAGYRIAYVESDGEILCVAGFVVGIKLAWGKHIYVDDLITAESHRSKGAGTEMISWLKSHARQLGCNQLHLDSGVQRFSAHRFYLREGFNIGSHHFSIIDLSNDDRKRGPRAHASHGGVADDEAATLDMAARRRGNRSSRVRMKQEK
jgi:GNAT superfamily N-acetyltransferase